MNTKKLLLSSAVFLIAILFTACKPAYLLYMGIKNPKVETVKSIHKDANRFGTVEWRDLYVYKDQKSYNSPERIMTSAPQAFFFSKDGVFVPYRPDSISCSASLPRFLENIEKTPAKLDTTMNLAKYSKGIINAFTHGPLKIENLPEADYYMLVTRANSIGRLNRDAASWIELARAAKESRGVCIHPIVINFDPMYFWPDIHKGSRD